jgi:hypothetical protein
MANNTGRHYKKHIITGGFFSGDRLLLWDSIVTESALPYFPTLSHKVYNFREKGFLTQNVFFDFLYNF